MTSGDSVILLLGSICGSGVGSNMGFDGYGPAGSGGRRRGGVGCGGGGVAGWVMVFLGPVRKDPGPFIVRKVRDLGCVSQSVLFLAQ